MNMIRTLVLCILAGAVLCTLAACESEFVRETGSARPTRAVTSPGERNSATGEMSDIVSGTAVPIVEIDLPNNNNEQPQVHTIADAIMERPATPAGTPPATRPMGATPTFTPAATQQHRPVDPVAGPQD